MPDGENVDSKNAGYENAGRPGLQSDPQEPGARPPAGAGEKTAACRGATEIKYTLAAGNSGEKTGTEKKGRTNPWK